MNRILVAILILIAAAGIIALAMYQPRNAPARTTDPEIAVTIFPLYDIVKNIAGDAVDVHLILPTGANPHTYEPTPSDVAAIDESVVMYRIGYGLDDWATDIASAHTDVLPLSVDIPLRTTGDGAVDPHYWLTITNAKTIATLAAQDLGSHFPAHRAVFQQNLATYLTALDNADLQIRAQLAELESTNIVTMHDAWYYFAEHYGLTIAGTFETAAAEEPTPQHLAELTAAMSSADIHTIFVDIGESEEAVEAFAADTNATLVTVDPEGAGADSYINLMLANARAFSQNR